MPLTSFKGKLYDHMMDWIIALLNPKMGGIDCRICTPYLVSLLRLHVASEKLDGLGVFMEFVHDNTLHPHKKMSPLLYCFIHVGISAMYM